MILVSVVGYSGGDIASLRFNADGGGNYWDRHLHSAAGGTTWTNAQNASTTLIRLAAPSSTLARTVTIFCTNIAALRDKTCTIQNVTSTGSAATVGRIDMGSGQWRSAAATQITSIEMLTAGGQTMTAGTGIVIYGKDF
jgi:hypothetical protein